MQNHVISKKKESHNKVSSWHVCGCFEQHSTGNWKKNLFTVLQVIWPLKYGTFLQLSSSQNSSFLPINRSLTCFKDSGPLLAFHTSHKMLSTVLKCSQPRTSGTAISASGIVAGPYFSALLPGACHYFPHILLHNSLKQLCWICLVGLQWRSFITWIFDSLNCWCMKGLYCCMSLTWSKLSLLQDLFGDDIPTLLDNTSFSVKNIWFVFLRNHMILRTFVISLPSLDTL